MGLWYDFDIIIQRFQGRIHLESDCQVLVTKLMEDAEDFSPVGTIMDEFKKKIVFHVFDVVILIFFFGPREANRATHLLAKL